MANELCQCGHEHSGFYDLDGCTECDCTRFTRPDKPEAGEEAMPLAVAISVVKIDAVTDFKARLIERLEELERCNNPKLDDSDYGYAHAIDEVKKIVEELC